jgi:hypothetical protein
MEVIEGHMIFYLDGKEIAIAAGEEPILIKRGHVHGFTASIMPLSNSSSSSIPTKLAPPL